MKRTRRPDLAAAARGRIPPEVKALFRKALQHHADMLAAERRWRQTVDEAYRRWGVPVEPKR